jgi:hypothetical protein
MIEYEREEESEYEEGNDENKDDNEDEGEEYDFEKGDGNSNPIKCVITIEKVCY